ncbi:MAG: hypothetical protein JWO03_2112 [Bacteroidetes bacterium]|nr:hypothetical protein [Bacteroidota bacterium]
MKSERITVEQTYDAPIARVWQALTDPVQMKQWYLDIPEFRPEVGCEFSFLAGDDKKKWLHHCKVTEVEPGKSVTYSWRYDGEAGNSFVTFALSEQGDKTHLKITHSGLNTFPDKDEFRYENFNEGWTCLANQSLPEFLAKQPSISTISQP